VLIQRVKASVRSVRFLYDLLSPSARKTARFRRELLHARQYCLSLPEIVSKPVFVKVGANDGITGDPFSDILLTNVKWTGLLIEPAPNCFDRLKAIFHDARRFSLEQVAIGATAGEAIFYYVDQKAAENLTDLPSWYDQLGSFDKNHILKHLDGVLEPFIIECKVEVFPLTDILRRNGIQDVHFLHIDTEGYDYEILKSFNLADQIAIAIFIEHKHLSGSERTEMRDLLRKCGYSVHDCGGDFFALNENARKGRH